MPRKAIGRAAAGRERHDVAAACDLAGDRSRIVPRAVHEDEPLAVDRLGIAIDAGESRRAALRHRAEGFFQDGGQPALFVAGRGVVVHRAAVADEKVGGMAERRVRRDARPGIGAAALQREHELRRGTVFALGPVGG